MNRIRLLASAAIVSCLSLTAVSDGADDVTVLGEPVRSHGARVTLVDMSPDGKLALSTGVDKTIRLWSVETGAAAGELKGHDAPVAFAFFYDGGERVVSFDVSGELRFWDAKKRRTVGKIGDVGEVKIDKNPLFIHHGALSPDRKELAFPSPTRDKVLRVDLAARKLVDPLTPEGQSRCVAYTPDGKGIIVGHQASTFGGGRVTVWHRRRGKVVYTQKCPRPMRIAVAADSKSYAIASSMALEIRGVGSGKVKASYEVDMAFGFTDAFFSSDRKLYLSMLMEGDVLVWDLREKKISFAIQEHDFSVSGLALAADGELLVTGGSDTTVRFWNAKTGDFVHPSAGHRNMVTTLAFSADGERILSGGYAGRTILWDAEKGRAVHEFAAGDQRDAIAGVAILKSGGLFSLDGAGRVRVRDVESGKIARKGSLDEKAPRIASFSRSRSSSRVVTGHYGSAAKVWDIETGQLVKSLSLKTESVSAVALSPDGKTVALAREEGGAWAVDVETGKGVMKLADDDETEIDAVAFIDDTTVVAVDGDDKLRRYDLTAKKSYELASAQSILAVSPDGKTLAAHAHDESVVVLLDTSSWKERGRIDAFGEGVTSVAFSPDGRRLAAGLADSTVRVCPVGKGKSKTKMRSSSRR